MEHFRKSKDSRYRYLLKNFTEYRLYPYTPRNNEFEKGLKYRLCESFYHEERGEQVINELCKVSGIKEAEELIAKGRIS